MLSRISASAQETSSLEMDLGRRRRLNTCDLVVHVGIGETPVGVPYGNNDCQLSPRAESIIAVMLRWMVDSGGQLIRQH